MKIVKVAYTTKADYAAKNQENIQKVMADLRERNNPGINYNTCVAADGCTFIHTAFFKSDDDQKLLNELDSFKDFQVQLKASGPATPPKQELLSLVGTSQDIFHA